MNRRIAMAVVLLSWALPGSAQEAEPDAALPAAVVAAAEAIVLGAASIDRVWPGFWARPRPYLVLDFEAQDRAVLFTLDEPPEGFDRVPDSRLPPALRGHLFSRAGPLDPGLLAAAGPVPTERTPMPVPLASPLLAGYTQTELILHETFHMWQRASWDDHHRRQPADCTPQRYEAVEADLPVMHDEAVARELDRLADAVAAPDDERAAGVRAFLDARLERVVAADPVFIAIDQRQERLEGTADFTGLASSLALRHPHGLEARQALQDSLVLRLHELHRRAAEMRLGRSGTAAIRAYRAGAAMAFLLDALGAARWREEVQHGEFLDILLARFVGATDYLDRLARYGSPRPC